MIHRPSLDEALKDIAHGRMIIVDDDADPTVGADLTMAAEFCDADDVGFMRLHASGVICTPMIGERLDSLRLPPMSAQNDNVSGSAFTISVDAKDGITTGISAADRALTIALLANPATGEADLVRPGHIFPLRARPGGVLVRRAQTEAAVDLCTLAGVQPVGVISHITSPDGSITTGADLNRFARKHGLKLITIGDLVAYRIAHEDVIKRQATTILRTKGVEFTRHAYSDGSRGGDVQHVALVLGRPQPQNTFAYLHRECFAGDVLRSTSCDCGRQFEAAIAAIANAGRGVLVYLRDKDGDPHSRALALADQVVALQILKDVGIRSVRVVTSDPPTSSAVVPGVSVTEWLEVSSSSAALAR